MPARPNTSLLAAFLALLAFLAVTLVGCAADDPNVTTTAPAPTQPVAADPGHTPGTGGTDCLGNPAADPASSPPSPGVEIPRPDDRLVDLRGQDRVEIPIRDNVYEVRWFRVDPCTEIVFVNQGANPHNVVPIAEGAFPTIDEDSLEIGPQTLVVAAPGDYPFFCSIHGTDKYRGQTGYLVVGDA